MRWSGMANAARTASNGSNVRPVAHAFPIGAALRCIASAPPPQVLLAINLGLTISDTGLLFQHSEMAIRLWLTRAGEQGGKVHARFFRNLTLGHLQLDELFTTLRDKAHDLWVWAAFDPITKLIPALQLGPRTQHMAYALLHVVTLVLAPGCLPIFTSDGLDLYFYALTAYPSAALRTSFGQ